MDTPPAIPNFKTIGNDIYRGGQPGGDADWDWLKRLGITRVIKLNTQGEGSDIAGEALGLDVLYFPIPPAEQVVFLPNKESVMAAVQAIAPHTFIHCGSDARTHSPDALADNTQGGQDRTGLIVGLYRVFDQGWTKAQAWDEMLANGFHPELLGLTLFFEWAV